MPIDAMPPAPPPPATTPPATTPLARFGSRHTIDRLRAAYLLLVAAQIACVVSYECGVLAAVVALLVGLATSLLGPVFSLAVSLHIFAHRRVSGSLDVVGVAVTYAVTCLSFAVLYLIVADHQPNAFTLPPGTGPMRLGAAMYFSVVTITTTGYGDITPLSGLARIATCAEILVGLSYQVFVFSLAASLLSHAAPPPRPGGGDGDAR